MNLIVYNITVHKGQYLHITHYCKIGNIHIKKSYKRFWLHTQHVQSLNAVTNFQSIFNHAQQTVVMHQSCSDNTDVEELVAAGPDIKPPREKPLWNSQYIQWCSSKVQRTHDNHTQDRIAIQSHVESFSNDDMQQWDDSVWTKENKHCKTKRAVLWNVELAPQANWDTRHTQDHHYRDVCILC